MLYVRWAAFQELALTESADPYASLLAPPLVWPYPPNCAVLSATYRAQHIYLQSLNKAKTAESKSAVFGWSLDK